MTDICPLCKQSMNDHRVLTVEKLVAGHVVAHKQIGWLCPPKKVDKHD